MCTLCMQESFSKKINVKSQPHSRVKTTFFPHRCMFLCNEQLGNRYTVYYVKHNVLRVFIFLGKSVLICPFWLSFSGALNILQFFIRHLSELSLMCIIHKLVE